MTRSDPTAISASVTEHKHYVPGGAGLVGVHVKRAEGAGAIEPMRYYHADHPGSVQVITNEAGTAQESLAYEP